MAEIDSRVYLRPVASKDGAEFLALMHASRRLHEPWINPPLTRDVFDHYIARCCRDDHEGWLVCHRQNNKIVGVINLNNIVRGSFLCASLGYYVGLPFCDKGYMQEGLQLLIKYAFEKAGLHRLEANIQPNNLPSIALVKRCGFHKEGEAPNFLFIDGKWRNHERWARIDARETLDIGRPG